MIKKLTLRKTILDDALLIRKWRNEQINILRQNSKVKIQDQLNYFKKIYLPNLKKRKPNQVLYTILENNTRIGYGGIVHIDWTKKVGEMSFVIDPKKNFKKKILFKFFLTNIKKISKHNLKIKKIIIETFSFRYKHLRLVEQFGFKKYKIEKKKIKINGRNFNSIHHYLKL